MRGLAVICVVGRIGRNFYVSGGEDFSGKLSSAEAFGVCGARSHLLLPRYHLHMASRTF